MALQDVQAKLSEAQHHLPRDMDPPTVSKSNPEDQPIVWLTLSGDLPIRDMMSFVQDRLKQKFQTVPGVGEVFLGGITDRNLRVWLDAKTMEAKQITAEDVLAAIQREHVEVPGGRIDDRPDKEFNIRTLGEFPSAEKFQDLLITQRGGQPIHIPIHLHEIARVEDGLADIRRLSRVNGERALGLGIRKQRGANAVAVAREVMARKAEVEKTLPKGLSLGVRFDSTKFIKDAVHELNFNLILSALLTSLVCYMFLGSWSSTFNILMAIPTSILGTFIVAYFMGFTLNSFSLLGLTLAIGIVVDDAIMVLENIVRHREAGLDKTAASSTGAREISFAALAATIAILAIFIPVVFMKGIIGKYFYQFGVTISAAVMLSLLEALTLTPMRTSQFIESGARANPVSRTVDHGFRVLARLYRRLLDGALRFRWSVLLASTLFFGGSLLTVNGLRKEFVPSQDQGMFMLRVRTPVGSSLEFTDKKMREIEGWLMKQPAISHYFSSVGGFGGGDVSSGMAFVTLKPLKERPGVSQTDVIKLARKELNKIPDVKAMPMDPSQSGFGGSRHGGMPVEVSVRGPDWDRLVSLSARMMRRLQATGLLADLDTDYREGMPEVRIYPDRDKAYARGVSVNSIGVTINAMIGGVRAGYFTQNGRRYEVRVRTESKNRLNAEDIGRIYVRNNRGEMIRLSDVTHIEQRVTLLSILRKDRERAIGIMANVAPGKSQTDAIAAVEMVAK